MFLKTETHTWPSRHTGEESREPWVILNNSRSNSHLYLTLEQLFLYLLLNKIRTHTTVNFCNSFTEIITIQCRRLMATPSLGITPIPLCKRAHPKQGIAKPHRSQQSPGFPGSSLITSPCSLNAELTCKPTLGGMSFCPLSLPLPPSLLANFYSSFRAQLQSHPLSNANTSNRGQKCNSSLILPTVPPAHSFQIWFFLVLAELLNPPQVPVLPLGTITSNTLSKQWLQVHTPLPCQRAQHRQRPTLAHSCSPGLCSPSLPPLLNPRRESPN